MTGLALLVYSHAWCICMPNGDPVIVADCGKVWRVLTSAC